MRRFASSVVIATLLVACTDSPTHSEAAGGGGGHEEPTSCDAPDQSCPAEMPFPGAPCAGALACDYDDPVQPWRWECVEGRWSGTPDCSEIVGGACGVPDPAEACQGAFSGSLEGASVSVGPSELGKAFRAFESGEPAEIVWGPQGGAMIFYRVQIDGADVPSCVAVATTVTAAGISPQTVERPVRLRCGETLAMYEILPEGTCESNALVETILRVEVTGIGVVEVPLMVPGDAFCPAFG